MDRMYRHLKGKFVAGLFVVSGGVVVPSQI